MSHLQLDERENIWSDPSSVRVPDGFSPAPLDEEFVKLLGPFYSAPGAEGTLVIALRAERRHANRYGVVHGGLLCGLADVAIGMNLLRVAPHSCDVFSVNLNVDFVAHGRVGEWLEAHVALVKEQGRLRFGECRLHATGRLVARATAVFYGK